MEINDKIKDQLAERNRFIESLITLSSDIIYIYDLVNKKNVYSNDGIQTVLGYSVEDVKNMGDQIIPNLMHPDDLKAYFEATVPRYAKAQDKELISHKYRMKHKNGNWHWLYSVELIYKRQPDGSPYHIIGIIHDITESKKLEDAYKESEERFKLMMQQSPSVIELYDLDGLQIEVNRAYEDLWGFPASHTVNKFNVLKSKEVEDSGLMSYVKDAYAGKAVKVPEYKFDPTGETEAKGAGRVRWLSTRIYPLKDSAGNVRNIVITHEDISGIKFAEEERFKLLDRLSHSQKIESIGTLAGGIAHDFNNLLTGILNSVHLSKMHIDRESKEYKYLESAEKAIYRATNLTQQLLTFAKGGGPIKETTYISDLIKESIEFTLKGSNVNYEYILADDLWPVEADEGQMTQVINNLILNADQAMPEGGTIQVSINNIELAPDTILPLQGGRYVQISIQDKGTGISEDHLKNIFDPYFSTKEMGQGLGLSITYSIIKNHGGHISVESEIGVGTTFNIYLPASENKIEEKESAEDTLIMGQGKILLMDDDQLVRESIGALLTASGYAIEYAVDGDEAVDIYQKAIETSKPFDAVILDLTVPGGLGGKEAIKKLLDIDPSVKAIVSSGYSNDPVMANFREYGFSEVLAKPCRNPDELSKILHKALKG